MIRKSGREDELVHPAIFAFARWDQVWQYQTEQQAKPQHATAIHKPLHDDGALFVIQLYAGGIVMRMALKWSALTFCRPGEVRKAEWSEIDFEKRVWKIPAEKMKMRKEHRVPLSRQCMEILDTLRALNFSQQWIFPSVRVSRPISQVGVLTALRLMGYEKDDMCAHGFRAMASTLLNEQGWDSDVIEIQLAHVDKNSVRAVYNRAQYWSKRVEMMQAWADYLDKLKQEALQSLSFPG